MGNISLQEIVQSLLIIFFIAIPPWIKLRRQFKRKINKIVAIIMFLIYLIITIFTQNVLPFVLVIIIIYLIYHKSENESEMFFLRPLKDKKFEVIIQSVIFKVIITLLNLWFAFFLMGFGIKLEQQEIGKIFMNASWIKIIFLVVMTVIIAPILEEFIFRHTLYRQLSGKIGKIGACIITSSLFALLHFNFLGTISFFGVGIYNCYLYDKYGYRAAVINHFVFNFTSTFMIIVIKIFNIS